MAVAKTPDTAAVLGRRFCHALAEETAGLAPGSWCMVQTIAQRMGIPFEKASTIADDCARREWVDRQQHLRAVDGEQGKARPMADLEAHPAAAPRQRDQRRGANLLRHRHEGLDRRRGQRHQDGKANRSDSQFRCSP
jgi:hypothetical protein